MIVILVQSSDPLNKYCPVLSVLILLTISLCPLYSIDNVVGKGCRSLGLGSLGTKASGSMFSFILMALGHRYKSKQRKNRSFMNLQQNSTVLYVLFPDNDITEDMMGLF